MDQNVGIPSSSYLLSSVMKVLSYPLLSAFLEEKGISLESFSIKIISTKLPPGIFSTDKKIMVVRGGMSPELARRIVENLHDYNWCGDDGQHCIYFLASGDKSHTFCSVKCGSLICTGCLSRPKAKEVSETPIAGVEKYRLHKLQTSLSAALTKMRQINEPIRRLRDKEAASGQSSLLKDYEHRRDHIRHTRLGIVLRECNNWYNTVGVDQTNNGQMRKLTLVDLQAIRGIKDIQPMLESLDEEATKYVLRNNPKGVEAN